MILKKYSNFNTSHVTVQHENAVGAKKLIYDTIVKGVQNGESVMMLHRKTGVSRKTIYKIKMNGSILSVKFNLILKAIVSY